MSKKISLHPRLRNALIFFGLALAGMVLISIIIILPDANTTSQPASLPSDTPNFITATPDSTQGTATAVVPTQLETGPIATLYNTPTSYPLLVNPDTHESIPITWGDYPGPTIWPSLPIPPPMGIIPKPDGQINILLLGNDKRSAKSGTRTDTIILLTLNPEHGTASVTSFPRDLYVYAPGLTMYKINTIYARGGIDVLLTTFEYNFGVRPDHYVNINRNTFVEVVNALGGIDVYVPYPLSDPSFAKGKFSVGVGKVHMNGSMARWYVSSRNTTSDFSRLERQQAVLQAIFLKLLSLNGINRAEELFNKFGRMVQSDLTLNDLLPLIHLASTLSDTNRVSRHSVNSSHVTAQRLPQSGAYVLVPDQLAVFGIILQALQPEQP